MFFKEILLKILLCCVAVSGALEAKEAIAYKTYAFKGGSLYVAQSLRGILFSGVFAKGFKKCSYRDEAAFGDGVLRCGDYEFAIKNGAIKERVKLQESFELIPLQSAYSYSPEVVSNITINFLCSKDSATQNLLGMMYGRDFTCENGKEVFYQMAKDSMQEYLKDTRGKTALEYFKISPLEEMMEDKLYYFDDRILVFARSGYLYTGGAHGNSKKWGLVISKEDGIVHLNEIIDLNNQELKQILWNKYQEYLGGFKDAVLDYIDFENFRVSDAILLDYGEIVFIYQPYELLPYVYGIIELRMSLEEIERFGDFKNTPLEYLFKKN